MAKGGGASRPRFRLLPTLLLTAAILLLPTAVYAWGRTSGSFTIHHVSATGSEIVPTRRVVRLLRNDYLGRNLFAVTTKDVGQTLALLPYVAAVAVDRDFPDTLRVRVTEYEPALYAYAGKRWYVVSAEGHVICEQTVPPKKQKKEDAAASTAAEDAATTAAVGTDAAVADATTATSLEATSVAGAPVPTDKEARLLETLAAGPPGATFDLPRMAVEAGLKPGATTADRGVRAALALLGGLPASMPAKIAVVEADGAQLSLRFADGPVVVWGDSSRSLAKTVALRAVLDRYAQAGETCVYMDVSVPDRVLARPVLK
jgi:cell division septal protein FtsQ